MHAGIGRTCFRGGEQKPPGLPVSASSSPTPNPTVTQGRSAFFLLPSTGTIIIIPSIHYTHPSTSGGRAATLHYLSQTGTQMVASPKEATFLNGCTGRHITLQEESSNFKKGKTANWLTSMRSIHMDTFSQDSDSVKEARGRYFATHSCDWTCSNMEDLSDIFKGLTQEAGLLGESIFELQWSWEGLEHLKQANYIFQSQPKGLRFLRAVSAKESPKVMGLKGIHNPEALWHFARYTYCLWHGKYGQNEGTIVKHLRMVHYKSGLICDQCFGCPTTTSDTLCRHGHFTCAN